MQTDRVFFVGDVHGCFNELKILLNKADFDPLCHRLILLGDLINKGPHSFKVLSYARKTGAVTLIGNHELKFLQAVEKQKDLPPVLEKLKKDMGQRLDEWICWIKNWPVYIEENDFLAVHGGVVPGQHPCKSKTEYLVNIRYWDGTGEDMTNPRFPPWHELYTNSKLIVYAHWAGQGLKVKPNSIGLDTGCVYGGSLTGLWLPERKIVQTPSLQPQWDKKKEMF